MLPIRLEFHVAYIENYMKFHSFRNQQLTVRREQRKFHDVNQMCPKMLSLISRGRIVNSKTTKPINYAATVELIFIILIISADDKAMVEECDCN